MANLSSVLDQAAAEHGERPALRLDSLVLSYTELRDAAGRAASLLSSLGIAPGDRVAVMMPNVPAFPIAFYGALGAGAIVVPMNPLLKSREVAYYLGDSGAKVLFAWHEAAAEAAKGAAGTGAQVLEVDGPDLHVLLAGLAPAPSMAEQASDDDAVILYTSGTTGAPKGAELTHGNLTRNAELSAATMLNAGPGDVTMGYLPLFHVFGLTCGLNATINGGGTLTLLPRFDAGKALDVIGRFLEVHKALEPGKEVETDTWVDQAAACSEIEACRERAPRWPPGRLTDKSRMSGRTRRLVYTRLLPQVGR